MFRTMSIAALAAAILAAGLSSASAAIGPNGKDVNGGGSNGMSPQGTQVTGAGSTAVHVLNVELPPVQQ
jgi:ABC-type phosphate transport system substrate-binding protein